jgi:Ca2+-binding RTX toxin-like protein
VLVADFSTADRGVQTDGLSTSGGASSGQFTDLQDQAVQFSNIERFNVTGSAFADTIVTGVGDDIINGGAGNDLLSGNAGNDVINGEDGDDLLAGGAGDDQLTGGEGADTLLAGAGNDRLDGGAGRDALNGGAGADTFVYAGATDSTSLGFDTIRGFDYREDRIDLPTEVTGFTGLIETGTLNVASFDEDLAAAVNGELEANSAVIFRPDDGDFAGRDFAVIDANGDGVYVAGEDYVIEIVAPVVPIDPVSDFFI